MFRRIARRLQLVHMVPVLLAASNLLPADPLVGQELAALLERYLEESGQVAGIAAAVVTPGGVEMATAGWARESKAPSPSTLFELGSITKVFTSLLLAQLVEEGVVSLDTPIGDLIPTGIVLHPEVVSITLQELSTHTSGLPRLPTGLSFVPFILRPSDPYRGSTTDGLLRTLQGLDAEDMQGRGAFAYSNLGAALLGRLLESAAGAPWEELVRDRVLEPFGLNTTQLSDQARGGPLLAAGHRANLRRAVLWHLDAYAPAGALVSSLEDMVRFLDAVLHAESGPLAVSTEKAWEAEDGSWSMGLGWVVEDRDGERIVWHNGRTGGGYAFVGFLPESRRGVVVLTNTSHHGDPFAMGLLRGEPVVEPARAGWWALAFTLGCLALAPLALMGFLKRAAHAGADGSTRLGRIHLLDSALAAAVFLALAWKLGAWQVVPNGIWWIGMGIAGIVLVGGVRQGGRLPWRSADPRARNGLALASAGLLAGGLAWILLRV